MRVAFFLPAIGHELIGAIMVRKAGKLPGEVLEQSYALEYGEARLSLQASRQPITGASFYVTICLQLALIWLLPRSREAG